MPWSGFTAQINCKLKAPISVGAHLIVEGELIRREGRDLRKCVIEARLISDAVGAEEAVVHATCDGLFIMNKGLAVEEKQ